MTTEQIITLAKEKLSRDITDREGQEYIGGKAALHNEAIDILALYIAADTVTTEIYMEDKWHVL